MFTIIPIRLNRFDFFVSLSDGYHASLDLLKLYLIRLHEK